MHQPFLFPCFFANRTESEEAMKDNQKKIYVKSERCFVPVTDEVYYEYYRPIWAARKKAQEHNQCMCPKGKLYECDGDCCSCKYKAAGNVISLDYEYGEDKKSLSDMISSDFDMEELITDRILLEELLVKLEELDPDGRKIFEMLSEGLSDRSIAMKLGRKKSTFSLQMKKIRKKLKNL